MFECPLLTAWRPLPMRSTLTFKIESDASANLLLNCRRIECPHRVRRAALETSTPLSDRLVETNVPAYCLAPRPVHSGQRPPQLRGARLRTGADRPQAAVLLAAATRSTTYQVWFMRTSRVYADALCRQIDPYAMVIGCLIAIGRHGLEALERTWCVITTSLNPRTARDLR